MFGPNFEIIGGLGLEGELEQELMVDIWPLTPDELQRPLPFERPSEDVLLDESPKPATSPDPVPKPAVTRQAKNPAFAPYLEWRPHPDVDFAELPLDNVADILIKAVVVEGPIHLGQLVEKAVTDGGRRGAKTRRRIKEALEGALAQGSIEAKRPLGEKGRENCWLSIPGTTPVPRLLGNRSLGDVPPLEVAAALDALDDGTPDLYRRLGNKWRLGRISRADTRYLKRCDQLRG